MNMKLICAIAILVGGSALSGCASMKGDSRSLASTAQHTQDLDNIDLAYVAQIEKQAHEHFMEVLWVHPPVLSEPTQATTTH